MKYSKTLPTLFFSYEINNKSETMLVRKALVERARMNKKVYSDQRLFLFDCFRALYQTVPEKY